MDQAQLQQKIAEYYAKLPAKAQGVFSNMQWIENLKQISTKYSLNNKQIETLSTETTLALLGIIDLNEYEKILTEEIKLPKYSLDEMIVRINDSIFSNIRPELMEAFEKNNQLAEKETDDKKENTKLDERFSKLPEETKDAIKKSDYQTKIYEIGQKYNLTVYQMGILGESIISVMLGTTTSDKFEESLKKLGLPAEKITEIATDTNDKILKKIREELVKNINRNKVKDIFVKEEKPIESREEILKTIEKSADTVSRLKGEKELPAPSKEENTSSILEQKLSGSFQIPKVETEHTLNNISKDTGIPAKKVGIPNVDPYREIPQ